MRFGKKIWTFVLICVLLCASVFPASASDTQLIDTKRICDLTIRYFYTDTPVAGAQFSVYRIGDISEDGTYSLIGHFAEYPIDTSHLTEGVLSKTAELLYSYALWDQVEPDAVMTIREDGTTSEQLPVGLYLVAGQKFMDDNGRYTTGPMIVSLPHRASEAEPWYYDVTMEPKCSYLPKEQIGEVHRAVMKVWKDDNASSRPEDIRVALLRDTHIADVITLSDLNRWTHRWGDLSENFEWRVVEEPVDGYTVDVDLVLGIYLVANSEEEEPTPTPTPVPTATPEPPPTTEPTPTPEATPTTEPTPTPEATPTAEPTPTPEATPTTEPIPTPEATPTAKPTPAPTKPGKPTPTPKPDKPKLPQTGMLWWPVPAAAVAGLFLICAGWLIRKGEHHE